MKMDTPKKRIRILILGFFFLVVGCPGKDKNSKSNLELAFSQSATRTEQAADSQNTSRAENNQNVWSTRQTAITRAASKASPAVVGINVIQVKKYVQKSPFYTDDPFWRYFFPEYFRDKVYEKRVRSLGSGFIISQDGYLITNEHVVEDAEKIVVTLPGGEQHNAVIVGKDQVSDIALLKIENEDENLPFLEMGSSADLIVGEWVIALGNPFGLFELNDQPTVTVGVISALHRDWGRIPESNRVYLDMIQTDAAINHGNSGGPLVNALGQVIGMNTFIYTGSRYQEGFVGIGFAIPIDRIRNVVDQILQYGEVDRNYWLGFKVQDLNPYLIRALDLNVTEGALVTQVEVGSSADKAGLRPEDVIISAQNQSVKDAGSLVEILENMDLQVGDVLKFVIIRQNQRMEINMKLIHRGD
ncbi:MAG: serine protease HtrA [Calditrichia bacterium]